MLVFLSRHVQRRLDIQGAETRRRDIVRFRYIQVQVFLSRHMQRRLDIQGAEI